MYAYTMYSPKLKIRSDASKASGYTLTPLMQDRFDEAVDRLADVLMTKGVTGVWSFKVVGASKLEMGLPATFAQGKSTALVSFTSEPRIREIEELRIVKHRILDLLEEEEDEEYDGADRPTPFAVKTALQLVTLASVFAGSAFTRAAVSTSHEGGIRVQWMREHASVRLVVPPDKGSRGYIYYEYGEDYNTEEITPLSLAMRLTWLQQVAGNERIAQ